MKTLGILAAAAVAFATPSVAVETRDCDTFEANAQNVNWADPTRVFANGAIRLIALDTEEPVCCSAHLMVLHPAADEPFLACTLVSQRDGSGWAAIRLRNATANYDPAQGLAITVPVGLYNGAGTDPGQITITVNQSAGTVIAQ